MPAEVDAGNVTVYQEYYATRIKDYVLSIILSYKSDTEKDELYDILNTIHFSK
jgi:hypothetical protein